MSSHLTAAEEEELVENIARSSRKIELINSLLASEGWKYFEQALTSLMRAHRISAFDVSITSMDNAFLAATVKGQVAGLQLALAHPKALREDSLVDKDQYQEQLNERESDAGSEEHGDTEFGSSK